MKNYLDLLKPLNLIYYEYDSRTNTFCIDNKHPTSYHSMELVSITNFLRSHKIKYAVDREKNVILNAENSLYSNFKRYCKSIYMNYKNKNKNIYILSDKKVKLAKNLPMIEIEPIEKKIDYAKYDALVFTSKNAILVINEMDQEWKKKPSYVIAPQTAKIVKKLNGRLVFTGKTNHGNSFAKELIEPLKGKKVLYLGALEVASNLVALLNENGVHCDNEPIYKTVCKKYDSKIQLPENSIIIFSSPSTIKCFFENIDWQSSYKAVAIGETTAEKFPSDIVPYIADTTSLESCVSKALEVSILEDEK
jgi:uroporphyrinogen-III synthase